MSEFDFITENKFRIGLEKDFAEMTKSIDSGMWKSAQVLAGSIVEAVLLNYLIDENVIDEEVGLKTTLGKTIDLAYKENLISEETSNLSIVIKEYRNLIHPGRIIRTQNEPDEDKSRVALSIVNMIAKEIRERRYSDHGYTAEQIVSKIERDSAAESILVHLLSDLSESEKERLLRIVVPDFIKSVYGVILEFKEFEASIDPDERTGNVKDPEVPRAISQIYRLAFGQADDLVKKELTQEFINIIKEKEEDFVFLYAEACFRMADLKYLSPNDRQVVKDYCLPYFTKNAPLNIDQINSLSGICDFLLRHEVYKFIDPLVKSIRDGESIIVGIGSELLIKNECARVRKSGEEIFNSIVQRLNVWVKNFNSRKQTQDESRIIALISEIQDLSEDDEIPF